MDWFYDFWSGGHWNTLYSVLKYSTKKTDMRMDVTNLVLLQLSGSVNGGVENEGFIIKREGNVGNSDTTNTEGSGTPLGTFSFFSRETHTIYQPKLEVVWNDSKWVTGSLSSLTSEDLEDLVLYGRRGLKKQYREDSKIKFRLIGRPLYVEKTFSGLKVMIRVTIRKILTKWKYILSNQRCVYRRCNNSLRKWF